jgi:hypothetical protein
MNSHSKFRKYCLLLPLLLLAAGAFAQDDAIGKFFGKYIEDSRFTVVSLLMLSRPLLSCTAFEY